MKEYYLFPAEGSPVKIEIDGDSFTFCLKDDLKFEIYEMTDSSIVIKQNRVRSSFTREQLINQLETLLHNVKKKV